MANGVTTPYDLVMIHNDEKISNVINKLDHIIGTVLNYLEKNEWVSSGVINDIRQ